jgi:Na+-driven multidrug efflux pump
MPCVGCTSLLLPSNYRAAYFQAAGNAKKALLLTLSKQGFFLIPLVLLLPNFFGILESGSPSLLRMYCQLY